MKKYQIIKTICDLCKKVESFDSKIVFDYTNVAIVKRKILNNVQGWGAFPNKCIEVTFEDGKKDCRSFDYQFFDFPDIEYAYYGIYIARISEPEKVMKIQEVMLNGFIVSTDGKKFNYIPKYTDFVSLGYNKKYKHPKLSPANKSEAGIK
jgi:hypothetical protein